MITKQKIYELLRAEGITFRALEHEAAHSMQDVTALELEQSDCIAKNIFVRDRKRHQYYLITVRGDKQVDTKAFRHQHGTQALTFAHADELPEILGLQAGSVSPLGLLNDREHRVLFFLDRDFFKDEKMIAVHPNDNTASLWLRVEDLTALLEKYGHKTNVVEIDVLG